MKFQVKWTADNQVIMSDYVDSLNNSGAEAQVVSMRGNMPGFRIIGVYGTKDSSTSKEDVISTSSSETISSDYEVSSNVVVVGIASGILIALYGLTILPTGIIAFLIGGAIAFLCLKLGGWLADRGW